MFTIEEIYETINDYTIEELVEIQKKCDDLIEDKRREEELIVDKGVKNFFYRMKNEYHVSFMYDGSPFDVNRLGIIRNI